MNSVPQKKMVLSGTVKDNRGDVMPGVTVRIKGPFLQVPDIIVTVHKTHSGLFFHLFEDFPQRDIFQFDTHPLGIHRSE